MNIQLVYITFSDFEKYKNSGCFPCDGAFIESKIIHSLLTTEETLSAELLLLENYRAKTRKVQPRNGNIIDIYVEYANRKICPYSQFFLLNQIRRFFIIVQGW